MEEFDAFGPAPTTTEQDPAADFLAREQTELAGLGDFGGSEPVQPLDGGSGLDIMGSGLDSGSGLLGEDPAPAMTEPSGTGGTEVFELGGDTDFSQEQPSEPADAYSAISQQDTLSSEPEKLKLWREEHAKRLEQKDAAEDKAKDEWRQKAKKELDDWYKHHSEQLQKTKETNRAAEEAFIQDRDEKSPSQAWERVTRLCEFNPKNSKNTKDVGRMRSILLQMKQTPLVR